MTSSAAAVHASRSRTCWATGTFASLTLKTDARALVPRPETEVVVERCLALLDGVGTPRILDVGTGTGAIALALKQERNDALVVATDSSAEALELARENAERNGLGVDLHHGDLLAGLLGPFHLVVSNPPYVAAGEIETLQPEVRDWEPRSAFVDEEQTARLIDEAQSVLEGPLVLEVHEARANDIAGRLEQAGYVDVHVSQDLTGRDRIVDGRWTP